MKSNSSFLEELKRAIAERVLIHATSGARIINSSGESHRAPWIFDFRAVMLESKWLDAYADIFWEKHAHLYPFQVGGMETAGIPLVSAIVMKSVARGTPVNGFFIRKSRKREGLMKVIEGTLTGEPVILVDDLMNSGQSFLKQVKILDDVGATVSRVFAILVFRSAEAYAPLQEKGVTADWLFTVEDFGLSLQDAHAGRKQNEYQTVWKRHAPVAPSFEHVVQKSAPALDEEHLYIGTDAGTLYALEQETGEAAWSFQIGKHPDGKGIFSTPVVHKGLVYFGAYDGNVYALDALSGTVQWKFEGADWVGSSPAIAANLGLVYIGLEFGLLRKQGGIAALDMTTGKQVWSDRTPLHTHGSPLFVPEESIVVVGSNDGVVYAYEATSGKRKWQYQTGADIKTRPAYDPKRRLLLIPSMDGKLYALSAVDGTPVWALHTSAGIYSNPLVSGDAVFVASLDKTLYKADLDTGREQTTFQTQGRIFSSPIIADGSLWIGSNDGRLYELDPDTLRQRGFFQATERIVNAVAYDSKKDRLFVPTIANELYCLSRKK